MDSQELHRLASLLVSDSVFDLNGFAAVRARFCRIDTPRKRNWEGTGQRKVVACFHIVACYVHAVVSHRLNEKRSAFALACVVVVLAGRFSSLAILARGPRTCSTWCLWTKKNFLPQQPSWRLSHCRLFGSKSTEGCWVACSLLLGQWTTWHWTSIVRRKMSCRQTFWQVASARTCTFTPRCVSPCCCVSF